jgi:hypothetical protein
MSETAPPAATEGIETWDTPDPAPGALPIETDPEEAAEPAPATHRNKTRKQLAAEVEALRAEVARLRAGEEPVAPHDPLTTGGHLLWVLGHANADMRQRLADICVRSLKAAGVCAEANHETTIAVLRHRLSGHANAAQLARTEAERLDRTSGPEGRAVAMALTYALLPTAEQG